SPKEFAPAGPSKEFSKRPPCLLMLPNWPATLGEAKSHIRPFASLATGPMVAVETKAAPLRMIRFWRSLAIRDCAPPSSQAALNWERLIGGATAPATPRRIA